MRRNISIVLKILIAVLSFLGVFLACFFATRDGYSHWYKRLFYFTQQSNIWIGVTSLVVGILYIMENVKKKSIVKNYLHVLRFIFIVSITITGIIFCCLLAPFASEDYNTWAFSSIATHVLVPVLSIADLFVDHHDFVLKKRHIFYALIPPIAYLVFALIMGYCNVDFGMGDPFPYFFLNFKTEVGLFGFKDGNPPELGTFYWLVVITMLVMGVSYMYYSIEKAIEKKHIKANSNQDKSNN